MYKKILTILITLSMILTILPNSVFAVSESDQIKEAMNAIKTGKDTAQLYNDMTADEFLGIMAKLLPEDSTVTLSFTKETDYRIWNASSTKDGSIFANILFTCGVYTQHEMYDIKMPMLTGEAAELNADNEKLDEDAAAVSGRLKTIAVNNESTKEEILEIARENIKNGSTVEWVKFEKVDSTSTAMGSIKGTLKLTLNNTQKTVEVSKLIRLDIPENKDIPRTTPQPKTTAEPQETAEPEATPAPTQAAAPEFTDVEDGAYYAYAVKWAVEKKITAGTSDTTFSPDDTCTRAQILTFLWRSMGSPKSTSENPFSDVNSGDYYYDAAVWANDKGMVAGDTFDGDTPCTRSMTVTYLWKNAGSVGSDDLGIFDDVPEDSDYSQAVSWAVLAGVTSGTSDTTFSPDEICSRGQIVTFLNRAIEEKY